MALFVAVTATIFALSTLTFIVLVLRAPLLDDKIVGAEGRLGKSKRVPARVLANRPR